MTDKELGPLADLLQHRTAANRLGYDELLAALRLADAEGWLRLPAAPGKR